VKSASRRAVIAVVAAALAVPIATAWTSSAFAGSAGTPTRTQASSAVQHVCSTAVKPGFMNCFALRLTNSLHQDVRPGATPQGYGPSDLDSAYNLSSAGGSGATIGIIDAYDDPNAESDLGAYRSQFGLPACTTANGCFKKVNQNGATSPLPAKNQSWSGEISLDVDMVSAICPNCHILLVEATSPSTANLGTAVNAAVAAGAKYVSNSYGGSETGSEASYDASYYHHPGVAVTASTGDDGYGVEYPASSQYVTAVGGTSLTRSSGARGWTETAWSDAGSGCSSDETKPTWQGTVTTGCTHKANADVSAVADPNTGVAVYQTYGGTGWAVYGGTSASSPIIASVYALAGTPGASDTPASYPYSHTANLYDVTSGSNGSCSPSELCKAGVGWDGPTGLGTPNGTAAFAAGGGGGGQTVTVTNPGTQSGTVGTAVSLQLSASGGTAPYSWTATGLPNGLTISSSGLISGTPTTAGNFTVTATATDSVGNHGAASFGWNITSGGGGSCSGNLLGNPGFETGSAAPWTTSTGVVSNTSDGAPAHSGSWFAWLDGYGKTHTDTVTQTVTIPSGCTVSLSYWLYISTQESGTHAYDTLTVALNGTTVASYSNANATGGVYKQFTVNASAYAGKSVTLTFTGKEDASLATSFLVDDTGISLS
jgi:hypothetical protein